MSVITLTQDQAEQIKSLTWGQKRNDVVSRSVFGAQAVEVDVPLWTADLTVVPAYESVAGSWKALMLLLAGQTNQLAMWDLRRPVPLGTMRGSMQLAAAAAQGATSLQISAGSGQAGTTLLAGDMLGFGSGETQQVVMVTADAVANGSGVITVNTQPPLRNAFALASAVTWDKPKALFRRTESASSWQYAPLVTSGFALTLQEDWRS